MKDNRVPYWEDECPECGKPCKQGCKCPTNHRYCECGHQWTHNLLKEENTEDEESIHGR